jgi:hypothetical protein
MASSIGLNFRAGPESRIAKKLVQTDFSPLSQGYLNSSRGTIQRLGDDDVEGAGPRILGMRPARTAGAGGPG